MSEISSKESNIHPPYRIFYLESMHSITNTVMADVNLLEILIKEWNIGKKENEFLLIDLIQNIIRNAALISKFFWPSNRQVYYAPRGKNLRAIFDLSEPNVLQDKKVRDSLEHFDEKLDDYLIKGIAGNIMPSYVGVRPLDEGVYHFFRAYYIYECVFKILDKEILINPIVEEIFKIDTKLKELLG